MKPMNGIMIFFVALGLLCMTGIAAADDAGAPIDNTTITADDIPPYDGPVGPDSPLYGLKLAWEDLDESFTTNQTQLMEKQMTHARLRLSEARRELAGNRTGSAQEAIDLYWQKMNMTQARIAYYNANETGLLHAQEMHLNHQLVLENLLQMYPNNTGLARAYNNSLQLQEKFQVKTQVRFEKIVEKDNRTIMKAYRLEVQEENRPGQGNGVSVENRGQARVEEQAGVTGTVVPTIQNDNRGAGNDNKGGQNANGVSQQQGQDNSGPTVTRTQPQQQNSGNGQGTGNGNNAGTNTGNANTGNTNADKGNSRVK